MNDAPTAAEPEARWGTGPGLGRVGVADTHNDLLMAVVARPAHLWSDYFRDRWLPQLHAGAVEVQVLPVWVDAAARPEGALREMLRMVECAHRIAEGNPDTVALCRDGAAVRDTIAADRVALVLGVEGCGPIGEDVELLETLFRLGVRVTSLAHFGRTALADGSAEDDAGSRLTRAGVDAVELMGDLGMLLDISHLGRAGVEHVLEVSSRPVIATHSDARALSDHHRNLSDDHLRAVAAAGGVACINSYAPYVHPTENTMDRLLDQFEYVIELIGVDHVGVGPDFLKEVEAEVYAPWAQMATDAHVETSIAGFTGPADFPALIDGLRRRGYSSDVIDKVARDNVLRLFDEHLGLPRDAAGHGPTPGSPRTG